jgi:hypothetical protein
MQMQEKKCLSALYYFVPLAQSSTLAEFYVFPNEPHLMILSATSSRPMSAGAAVRERGRGWLVTM